MSSAARTALAVAVGTLPCLLSLGFLTLAGTRLARADEAAPPPATPPPAADPNARTEAAPGPGPAASAPSPTAVSADSVVANAAPRDTTVATGAAPETKEPQPAKRVENAAATPAEKPAEAPPQAPSKQGDGPKMSPGAGAGPKPHAGVATPKPGAKGMAVRGPRSPIKPRATPGKSAGKHGAKGAPAKPELTPRPPDAFTEADRVASELERTERFVGRAQKSILLSKNTRAIKLFTSALDFQSDSREACKVRQYARAERLTLAARDFADRASRMVGPPREDPDYVERVLRRTDDALDRAKDVLKTGAGRDAWNQHDDLREEQKDAWKVFKSGDVGSAYKQTLGVREGVLALLRRMQDLPVPRETAEKAIGGAQAALEQVSRELGPKPSAEAMRLVRLAGEYLAKARQSFSRGSYRSALLQAKVVERHVEHAVDVGRPRSG